MVNDIACQKQEKPNKTMQTWSFKNELTIFHKENLGSYSNGWILIYELSDCEFKFCFCHLYLR